MGPFLLGERSDILIAHRTKARVSKCERIEGPACGSTSGTTRVELNGICNVQVKGEPTFDGNFKAVVVDYAACDSLPDTYSIEIRRGAYIGKGDLVHAASGPMECGGLRVSPPPPAKKK